MLSRPSYTKSMRRLPTCMTDIGDHGAGTVERCQAQHKHLKRACTKDHSMQRVLSEHKGHLLAGGTLIVTLFTVRYGKVQGRPALCAMRAAWL